MHKRTRILKETLPQVEILAATLAEIQERAAKLKEELLPLLAEGTVKSVITQESDKGSQNGAAKEPQKQPTAADVLSRIEALVRVQPHTEVQIGRILRDVSPSLQRSAIASLRKQGRLYNLASDAVPRWQWRPGADSPAPERLAIVVRMLSERPTTLAELVEALACTRGQASGALVQITRQGRPLQNLGNGRHGLWYLPPVELIRG